MNESSAKCDIARINSLSEDFNISNGIVPSEYYTNSNVPVFGSVHVEKSSDVHFGDKNIFHGPVVVRQIINPHLPSESIIKRFEDYKKNTSVCAPDEKNEETSNKKCKFSKEYVYMTIFSIAMAVSFITIISILLQKKEGDSTMDAGSGNNNVDADIETAANSTLRYVSRAHWIAQPPSATLDNLSHPTPLVVITHTATDDCVRQSACVFIVRTIQTYHMESRGWSDIGYNFLVGGDGSVYVGRGWDHVGAHTLHYNSRSIGIAFIGTFNQITPPDKQVESAKKLIDEGVLLGKIATDYKLYGHRQLTSTLSPGDMVYSIIQTWPHWASDRPAE